MRYCQTLCILVCIFIDPLLGRSQYLTRIGLALWFGSWLRLGLELGYNVSYGVGVRGRIKIGVGFRVEVGVRVRVQLVLALALDHS